MLFFFREVVIFAIRDFEYEFAKITTRELRCCKIKVKKSKRLKKKYVYYSVLLPMQAFVEDLFLTFLAIMLFFKVKHRVKEDFQVVST